MKRIVRLNERDLTRIVKRVIKENDSNNIPDDEMDSIIDLHSKYGNKEISFDELEKGHRGMLSKYDKSSKGKSQKFNQLSDEVKNFNSELQSYFEDILINSGISDEIYDAVESGEISNEESYRLLKMLKKLN